MRLIGLHGPARCGKDTVGAILARHNFSLLAFATPLKDMLITGFGLTREQVDGAKKEEIIDWIGRSPRELMQTLGTEWGRGLVGRYIWLKHAERRLALYRTWAENVVITDLRFANEAAWVRVQDGVIWHITGRDSSGAVRADHPSEAGLRVVPGDIVIRNDGSLADLEDARVLALSGIGGWATCL